MSHFNHAWLLENVFKNYEKAREHYEMAVKWNPDSAIGHICLAIILKNHFNDEDANHHYELAKNTAHPYRRIEERNFNPGLINR
eukprot:UN22976